MQLIKILAICFLLLFPQQVTGNIIVGFPPPPEVYTETHYVTQYGAGTQDGRSLANAWSVANFNNVANWSVNNSVDNRIGPGDVVYFSGTITSTVIPAGNGIIGTGNRITIDGYEAGACNHMSGADSNGALIAVPGTYGIRLESRKYIDIQDFRVNNCSSGIYSSVSSSSQTPENITIRRVSLSDNANGVYLTSSIAAGTGGKYIIIEDCEVKDTAVGDTSSSKAGLRLANHEDLIIRRNHIWNSPEVPLVINGQDGMMVFQSRRVLIEYNRVHHMSEDCVDFKNDAGTEHGDVVIRFNHFSDARQSGVTVQHETGSNAYIYANKFVGNFEYYPVLVQRGFDTVYIWSNILVNSQRAGIAAFDQDNLRPIDLIYAYNNTIVDMGNSSTSVYHAGVRFDNLVSYGEIKNNILVRNNYAQYDTQISAEWTGRQAESDYNLFYLDGVDAPKVRWAGTTYTLTHPVSGTSYHTATGNDEHSSVGAPSFVDQDEYDLRLTAGSTLAIGTGATLTPPATWDVPTVQGETISGVSLATGLDPDNTDWTTTPPTVNVLTRTGAWDLGAYVYVE